MESLFGAKAWSIVSEKLTNWYESIVGNLPNLIVAFVVILIFGLLSKLAKRAIRPVIQRSLKNLALTSLFGTLVQFAILLVGVIIALGVLQLDKTVTSLLAGAGVLGVALGFAFQDMASNLISGVALAIKEPFKIGDIIEVDGIFGEVKSIDLRTTLIETFQGIEIYVPNKSIFTTPLKNFSGVPIRRLDLVVGVSYADNLEEVEKVLYDCLKPLKGRVEDRDIEVFFRSFGSSSIDCDVRVWVHYPADMNYLKVRHRAIIAIKKAFDENDITIPFPIRTLDFGIKGGENLKTPLQTVFSDRNQTP